MELIVRQRFGTVPDDPRELMERFTEAMWLDKRERDMLAHSIARAMNGEKG